jgi:hypothetical protein
MARYRRRHRIHSRGSRSLVRGVSNTTLAIGAAAAYLLMTGRLRTPGTAGLGWYEGITAPGLGLLHPDGLMRRHPSYSGVEPMGMAGVGTRTIGPGLGAWGRPVLPSAGLGWFDGFRGGLGAFEATRGFWPAHMQGGLGALVRSIHGQLSGAGLGTVHVTEYGNEFVGGHPRGLGRFGNVSINRRWWT